MKVFMIGTIICILFLIGLPSFAQEFVQVRSPESYPASSIGNSIPLEPGQAILAWRREPRNSNTIVSASIIPSYTFVQGTQLGSYGWFTAEGTAGVDGYTQYYTVIDPNNLYFSSASLNPSVISQIHTILSSKGLGSVSARARLIALYGSNIAPTPIILAPYFRSWVLVGFGLLLSFPMWWVVKRVLR